MDDLFKSVAKCAAFRHPTTGQIWEVGSVHDIDQVPEEHQERVEPGYVGHDGAFLTRDQVQAASIKKSAEEPETSGETDTILDGVFASEAIDKSGESLSIEGADISDFEEGRGICNYNHKDGTALDTIGTVIFAKKIFSEKDCTTDRQAKYWEEVKLPYIYGIVRLSDGSGHPGAIGAAAHIRDNVKHKEEVRPGFSIEGTTLSQDKATGKLATSICKRVALTFVPCNESAHMGIIHDAGPMLGLFRTESKHVGIIGASDLKKAIEAGNYDAAPSSLTGGAALQVESRGLSPRLGDAVKKWDGRSPLRAFLKMQMPEASDDYINRYADMAERYTIKKVQTAIIKKHLAEIVQNRVLPVALELAEARDLAELPRRMESLSVDLRKAADSDGMGHEHPTVQFQGASVKPGRGVLGSSGKPVAILGHTPEHFFVVPEHKVSGWQAADIKKVPRKKGGIAVHSWPEKTDAPAVIDSKVHGLSSTTKHPEVHEMLHGLELGTHNQFPSRDNPTGYNEDEGRAYWSVNAKGKHVYVKQDEDDTSFGPAHREALYHNLAKDFYGLGSHMTPTAAVIHPNTGAMLTVTQHVAGEHRGWAPGHEEALQKLTDSGELHKIALMNTINHNSDRHNGNYLLDDAGDIKLIDHGLGFSDYSGRAPVLPDYLSRPLPPGAKENPGARPNTPESAHYKESLATPLHQDAHKWLMSLDPNQLKQHMTSQGAPAEYANESSRRLQAMQDLAAHARGTLGQAMNAPWLVRGVGR